MPTNTWIAASAGQASNGANWSLGRAPISGDSVVFDNTSDNNCSWDLDKLTVTPDGMVLDTGYDGTMAQGSVDMAWGPSGYTQRAGTATFDATKSATCAGSWTYLAGAVTDDKLNLIMSEPDTTVTGSVSFGFRLLTFSANVSVSHLTTSTVAYGVSVASGVSANILAGKQLQFANYGGGAKPFTNLGSIDGAGTLDIYVLADKAITLGAVSCPTQFRLHSSVAASRTLSLGANTALTSTLTVLSVHATYTLTLHHGSNYALTVAGLTTLGVRAIMNQGTAQWSFNGGYTQNGASSVFNQVGPVSSGNVAISDGTLNGAENASITWTCSGDLIRSGGTIANFTVNLIMTGDGATLSSGVYDVLRIAGNVKVLTSVTQSRKLIVDEGKNFTISSGMTHVIYSTALIDVDNGGLINGLGTLSIQARNFDVSLNLGKTACAIVLKTHLNAGADRKITLRSPASLGVVALQSENPTYTCTLDTAGFALSHRGLTVGMRGAIKLNGSKVTSYGNTDTSAGSLDAGTSQYVQAAPGTIKLAAGQSLNDVEAPVIGLNLASDVTITGTYRHLRPAILNGFTLTYDPSKEIRMMDEARNVAMRQAQMAAVGTAI